MSEVRPIIIVTGATGGIGFGICQRLLFQLCHTNSSDALPQRFVRNETQSDPPPRYNGLTLILACRSMERATAAREKLFRLLDTYIAKLQKDRHYDGHAHTFRENVSIDFLLMDFATISTVFKFAEEVSKKYPYISHLICNAGYAGWSSIDWLGCIKQSTLEPLNSFTVPNWISQRQGEISADGLGWAWQCNLFAHYVLYRSIEHLLLATPTSLGSRVIWTSSLEANPSHFDVNDLQLKKATNPYGGAKYQIDIIGTYLDRLALKETGPRRLRHFVTHPGVCPTDFSLSLVGPVLAVFKIMTFYVVQFCGSKHHHVDPYNASIAAVHAALASITFLAISESREQGAGSLSRPVNFGSQSDRWGNEYVGILDIEEWDEHQSSAEMIVKEMDTLLQSIKSANKVTSNGV